MVINHYHNHPSEIMKESNICMQRRRSFTSMYCMVHAKLVHSHTSTFISDFIFTLFSSLFRQFANKKCSFGMKRALNLACV